MKHKLLIKNMVCGRCKTTVLKLFNDAKIEIESIELGKVVVKNNQNIDYKKIEDSLIEKGFELIKDSSDMLIEKIKVSMIKRVTENNTLNILSEITKELDKNYATISKIFSRSEGITLEKYLINLKIEKVKELIQLNQLNFTEIAYSLNYNNSSHLAKQFKSITGISMTEYRKSQNWNRKGLDQIV